MLNTIKKHPFFTCFVAFLFSIWLGDFYYQKILTQNMKIQEENLLQTLSGFHVEIPKVFEYDKTTINLNDYIKNPTNNTEVIASVKPSEYSLQNVGTKLVKFNFLVHDDKYGRDFEKNIDTVITVVDSQEPVIELKKESVTGYKDDKFKTSLFLDKVYDVVDGDLTECSKEITKGCWFIDEVPDMKKIGNYSFNVVAVDRNGNTTKKKVDYKVANKTLSNGKATYVDFDAHFAFADGHQAEVNAGYITRWGGDYWHHNWSSFMKYFNQLGNGTTVKLDGVLWRCGGVERIATDGTSLVNSQGHELVMDGSVQLVTCANSSGSVRLVAYLIPK